MSPMRTKDHEDVIGYRVCAKNCSAKVNGRLCGRRTCMDYRYCWQHLIIKKHLLIAPSRKLMSFGIPGKPLGLYAVVNLKTMKEAGRDINGIPNKTDRVVFNKGDVVDSYDGEVIDKNKRYPDPDDQETISYGVEGGDGTIFDGLSAARAVSYSNETINVKLLMEKATSKTAFKKEYREAEERAYGPRGTANVDSTSDRTGPVKIEAVRKIRHGDEILWTYGPDYWSTEGMKKFITGTGWITKRRKVTT